MEANKTQTGEPVVWKIITSNAECERVEKYAKRHSISEGEVFRRGLEALIGSEAPKTTVSHGQGGKFTSKHGKSLV